MTTPEFIMLALLLAVAVLYLLRCAECARLKELLDRSHDAYRRLERCHPVTINTGDSRLNLTLAEELTDKLMEIAAYNRDHQRESNPQPDTDNGTDAGQA